MKKYFLFILIGLCNPAFSFGADIQGKVLSLQGPNDVSTAGMTNLERKKFVDSLVVSSDGGLGNVVVYIEKIASPPSRLKKNADVVEVDQINNAFSPRVVAMTAGKELTIVNSDSIFHNVHAYINGENLFIANLPKRGQKSIHRIEKEGIVSMKCEVHLSMHAYAVVLSNPYFAVTNKDGTYRIADVPLGTYTLTAWHELLGKKTETVTVKKSGPPAAGNFTYKHITTVTSRWY